MNSARFSGLKMFVVRGIRERTRTVFSSGRKTLFLYCGLGRSERTFRRKHDCADRNNILLIPLRVTVLQEHEDREEYIDPEFEDLKVRSSHCDRGSRGAASPEASLVPALCGVGRGAMGGCCHYLILK